ncbi:DUF2147 domain-containing protein [Chryseotalea sanaruensis]|uniref:DUF2147 domain-containing protein n=1 Tax=Chryseotalea sanaruensis TaxID=2482724 RepID=A0A401UAF5_9BACT|nr:DUF2147 domain-containing protein [Chryseotalea sanaruensis]GCC51861.1 DUF2147 domain-containing protein [Chryseotalea sanaruensis]
MRLLLALLFISASGYAQTSVLGKWKTIDDETNKEKSVVEIFEKGGKVYGKITRLFRNKNEDQDPVCLECDEEDDRFKKKIIGMEIIRDMKKDGTEFSEGTILDPNNGKVYRCRIWLEGSELKVRGYLGPFYRTQTWLPFK